MNRLKSLVVCTVCAVVCALAFPLVSSADPIQVGDKVRFLDREGSTGGGEFGVAKLPDASTELFRTFCVQRTEFIDFNSAGFNVIGITDHALAGGDPLDPKTAFLYTSFRNNTLSGYDTSSTAARIASADALQIAIWFIEQEPGIAQTSLDNNALAQGFYDAAVNAAWTDIGNVRVMNLTWATSRSGFNAGDHAQDQLVLVPAPHPALAGTAMLGLLGGSALLRRKLVQVSL